MMTSLPTYRDAISRVLDREFPVKTERIDLGSLAGRVLAESIRADRDLPPFHRAALDGYALRIADLQPGVPMPVAGAVAAGDAGAPNVPAGACLKVATGAAVPEGLDLVIPHEQSNRGDPVTLTAPEAKPWDGIHQRGADAQRDQVLIEPDTQLAAHHLAIAASVGATEPLVTKRPEVAILTSGNEVISAESSPAPHQIRNSNAPMLSALLPRFGADVQLIRHLPDDRATIGEAVADALRTYQIVVTVGGISAGEHDHFPTAYEQSRISMLVEGAQLQPGKPIRVGVGRNGHMVFGLPGNPVSALVTAHLFIWPVVRRMLGLSATLPWRRLVLAEGVRPNPRRQAFRPAILSAHASLRIPAWAGSGDLVHTAKTHGIAALPAQSDPLGAGTPVDFLPWAG